MKLKKILKAIKKISIENSALFCLTVIPSGYWDISTIEGSVIHSSGKSINQLNKWAKWVLNEK